MILQALGKILNRRILKLHLELNFENFQTKSIIGCYNVLTIGIDNIKFHVNIIKDLGFTLILFLFLFYPILEGELCAIFFQILLYTLNFVFLSQYKAI